VEHVVHVVFFDEAEEGGEEVVPFRHYVFARQYVFLEDVPEDLDDFDPSCSQFGSVLTDLQFLYTAVDEYFQKTFEVAYDLFFLGQDEGHVGEVGEQDGGVIDRYVFIGTHHVVYYLRDDVQGKEGLAEFGYPVHAL
jgi:hypothetical protein